MAKRFLVCTLVVLGGCAPDAESPAQGTTDPPESSGTTGEAPKPQLHASFVPELEVGQGPALLRLFNDTADQILSLTLDDGKEYAFYLVEPSAVTDYTITVSDDLWEDAILSIHTLETCVRKPFAEMTGPLALEPGHAYGMHVTVDSGFTAHIEEEPAPEPFTGVRAHVADPSGSSTPAPAQLVLSIEDAPRRPIVFDTIFAEAPEPYVLVPASKVAVTKVRFVDWSGVAHESTSPVLLEGAYGYTVHVAGEVKDGAEASAELTTAGE